MSAEDQWQLQHSSVEVVVDATPQAVFASVLAIAALLWNVGERDIVTATSPSLLVHSVSLDGQVGCWLSWEIAPADGGTCLVRLLHDEADLQPSPEPELGEVMAVLMAHLVQAADLPRQQPSDDQAARET
jgi:hypothetical protein